MTSLHKSSEASLTHTIHQQLLASAVLSFLPARGFAVLRIMPQYGIFPTPFSYHRVINLLLLLCALFLLPLPPSSVCHSRSHNRLWGNSYTAVSPLRKSPKESEAHGEEIHPSRSLN